MILALFSRYIVMCGDKLRTVHLEEARDAFKVERSFSRHYFLTTLILARRCGDLSANPACETKYLFAKKVVIFYRQWLTVQTKS